MAPKVVLRSVDSIYSTHLFSWSFLRGGAIKCPEWPSYNIKGQRRANVAYYISIYIYHIFTILFPLYSYQYVSSKTPSRGQSSYSWGYCLCQIPESITFTRHTSSYGGAFVNNIRHAIMLINRLKSMKRSLFMVKTSLLGLVLKGLLCYVRSKLI